MRKMTKALSVLTVLAMLATLFVAAPVSAELIDDINATSPTINVLFTSDDAMETPVNPDTLAADEVFYAWLQFGNLPTDAYITTCQASLTWDDSVVIPYDYAYDDVLSDPADYSYASLDSLDFVKADQQYRKVGRKYYGQYACDDANGLWLYEGNLGVDIPNFFGYGFLPGNNGDGTGSENTYVQPNDDGTFTLYGFAFKKLSAGNVGVTIPAQDKTLNGEAVSYIADADAGALLELCDTANTMQQVKGAQTKKFLYTVAFTDLSPADSGETPTDEPEPTDEPLGEPTGEKQASNSSSLTNAFFYEFETPTIPGEVTGLTATFRIDGRDAEEGVVKNIDLTGITNMALNIAAVVMNIPAAYANVPVITEYVLSYTEAGAPKTLEWTRTDSLN